MENFVIESDSRTASGNGITVERCSFSHPCPAAEMHIHSSVEMVFLTRGKLEIVTRDNTFFISPGDLVLFRKYTIHGINVISDEGCEYLSIKFHMSILNDFSSVEDINHYLAFFSIDAKTDAFILQHDELEGGNIVSRGAFVGFVFFKHSGDYRVLGGVALKQLPKESTRRVESYHTLEFLCRRTNGDNDVFTCDLAEHKTVFNLHKNLLRVILPRAQNDIFWRAYRCFA